MKVMIEEGCIGCGLCAETCSEVFRMTEEGLAEVFDAPNPDNEAEVQEAAENCPVSVIITEED